MTEGQTGPSFRVSGWGPIKFRGENSRWSKSYQTAQQRLRAAEAALARTEQGTDSTPSRSSQDRQDSRRTADDNEIPNEERTNVSPPTTSGGAQLAALSPQIGKSADESTVRSLATGDADIQRADEQLISVQTLKQMFELPSFQRFDDSQDRSPTNRPPVSARTFRGPAEQKARHKSRSARKRAEEAFAAEDFSRAAALYKRVIDRGEDDVEARTSYAISLSLGDSQDADEAWQKVYSDFPGESYALEQYSLHLMSRGRVHDARRILDEADRLGERSSSGLATRAFMETWHGEPAEGVRLYREAIALATDPATWLAPLALALDRSGAPSEEVVNAWVAALEASNGDASIRLQYADYLTGSAQFDRAREVLTEQKDLEDLPEFQLALARNEMRAERFSEAATHYRRAISLGATASSAYANLAFTLQRSGAETAAVIDVLNSGVVTNPTDTALTARLVIALRDAGLTQEARGALDAALAKHPQDSLLLEIAANFAALSGDHEAAVRLYQVALKSGAESPEALSNYAVALSLSGAPRDSVMEAWNIAVKRWPDDTGVAARFAQYQVAQGELDAARRTLETFADADSNEIAAASALIELSSGNAHAAANDYAKAISLGNRQVAILGNFALALHRSGAQSKEVESAYRTALSANPTDVVVAKNYARFLTEEGRVDEARTFLNEAISTTDSPDLLSALAGLEMRSADESRTAVARARDLFEAAIERGATDAFCTGNYALLLQRSGASDGEILDAWTRALAENPRDENILAGHARYLFGRGDESDAWKAITAALDEAGSSPKLLRAAGDIAIRSGRPQRAAEFFRKAIDSGANDVELHRKFAFALNKSGAPKSDIMTAWNNAREAHPKSIELISGSALFLSSVGERERAESMLQAARAEFPDSNNALLSTLGHVAMNSDDYEEAISRFRELKNAGMITPPDAGALAYSLQQVGANPVDVKSAWIAAIDADPDYAVNLRMFASWLAENDESETAERLLMDALKLDRTGTLEPLARLNFHYLRDLDTALSLFEEAIEHGGSDDENVMANYTQLLFVVGRKFEALKHMADLMKRVDEQPDALQLELWFYWFAHVDDGSEEALSGISRLLEAGARSPRWPLEQTVARAIEDGHRNPNLLSELAAAISSRSSDKLSETVRSGIRRTTSSTSPQAE